MRSEIQSSRVIIAVLGVGLLAGACEKMNDSDRSGRAMERTSEAVRRTPTAPVPENTAVLQPTAPSTAPTAPSMAAANATMPVSDAVGNIVSARCDREQRCDHIGAGKRYESVQACRTALRNDLADDLNPAECSRGIDRRELSECMQQVREEDCGNPIETLERVVACRTSDLCRDTTVSLR